MSKHIQLYIPEQCHENWNSMTMAEKGRFCGSCQKQVVDFTGMNDEQMVAFFRKATAGPVCGRFMQDQLNRPIQLPRKRIPWVKYFFQFMLPAFLVSSKATAQGKVKFLKEDSILVANPKRNEIKEMSAEKVIQTIRGKVVDDNDEGIAYATVFIKGTTISVATDSTGIFSLKYDGKETTCVLVSSVIGFHLTETIVTLSNAGEIIIPMIPDNSSNEEVVMGMIITDLNFIPPSLEEGGEIDTTTIPDTAERKVFPSSEVHKSRVYPNPLKSNNTLTVEMNQQEKGAYIFQLLTINGQVILNKELWMDEPNRIIKIPIPTLVAGACFLRNRNKISGKGYTEKIIIE